MCAEILYSTGMATWVQPEGVGECISRIGGGGTLNTAGAVKTLRPVHVHSDVLVEDEVCELERVLPLSVAHAHSCCAETKEF